MSLKDWALSRSTRYFLNKGTKYGTTRRYLWRGAADVFEYIGEGPSANGVWRLGPLLDQIAYQIEKHWRALA